MFMALKPPRRPTMNQELSTASSISLSVPEGTLYSSNHTCAHGPGLKARHCETDTRHADPLLHGGRQSIAVQCSSPRSLTRSHTRAAEV